MLNPGFGHAMRGACAAAAAFSAIVQPTPLQDAPKPPDLAPPASVAGDYVHSEMELVAGIRLSPDGSFEYGLTVGALDERAQGRWKAVGSRIDLISAPRPVAPVITAERVDAAPGKPFAIRVLAPNGRDVPGVDLRIEFDRGEPLESYLAGELWSLPTGEQRVPRFVTFSMPSYRLRSERLPLDARVGTIAIFALTPNDFGVVDLTGVHAEADGERLTLHRPEGTMQFKRVRR
ncbi:hypothetical protein [Sphingomonas sp. Root241]|uniref:hypothetical protein n=1 Tax=Sphingomonas sp. Root241 TaxID=1736501 RepID=UPI0006F27B04|nr:hypothetical protein [Sphingomonas sp. Root241]KRC81560.1 hypothetical protein ASE13_04025 [Sphingomonas sp. Root241]